MVGAVAAGVVPDQRLHLGRRPGLGQPQVVPRHVHDGRTQLGVARHPGRAVPADRQVGERARLRRLLQGEQVQWHAGRRGHRRGRPWDEVEPGYYAASAHGHKRRCLLPPWLPDGAHGFTSPLRRLQSYSRRAVCVVFPGCLRSPAACVVGGPGRAPLPARGGQAAAGSPAPGGRPGCRRSGRARLPAAAIRDGVPPIHCWKTSLTSAACTAGAVDRRGAAGRVTGPGDEVRRAGVALAVGRIALQAGFDERAAARRRQRRAADDVVDRPRRDLRGCRSGWPGRTGGAG